MTNPNTNPLAGIEQPLQGLAAYLRAIASTDLVYGSEAHQTHMQWASEVDALTAARSVLEQGEAWTWDSHDQTFSVVRKIDAATTFVRRVTPYAAAALLQSTALPAPAEEARWVSISEDGEGQENYCEECGAEPGSSCTDVEGREWGRRVHAIRQEEPAALPVGGGLNDAQIDAVLGAAYLKLVKETGYTGGMGGETWDKAAARAILAASRSQLVREPLSEDQRKKLWHGTIEAHSK